MNIGSAVTGLGTINKAWAATVATPVANWLVSFIASYFATTSYPMPQEVSVGLTGLLVGIVVWAIPNLKGASA